MHEQLYKFISDSLKKEYEDGATYQQLAKKYNMSYQYIRGIILGQYPAKRLSLEYFFKFFPDASIKLNARIFTANQTDQSIQNSFVESQIGNGNTMHNHHDGGGDLRNRLLAYRIALQDAIIDLGLDPEGQAKILRVFRDTPME